MPKESTTLEAIELPTLELSTVLGASRKIAKAYEKWSLQDGPFVAFNGVPMKSMSQELVGTVEECIDGTADGDENGQALGNVAPDARRLMLCLDAIGYAFIRWVQDASMGLSHARPTGSDELDSAFKHLIDVQSQRPLPHPTSVKALMDQGAPLGTIALKYGWKMEDGSPDIDKVYEELETPSTHYDPKTWVHPAHRSAMAEVEKLWTDRKPRPKLFHDDEKTAPKPVLRPIEEMIEARAPIEQIARLYQLEYDEVVELAKAHGVDLTQPRHIVPANEAVAQQEMQRTQAARAAGAKAKRS